MSELAAELDTHRAGIYRLLGPLADQRLVVRTPGGRYTLGARADRARRARVRSRLQEVAVRELRVLADEVGATTALTIRDGDDAVVAAVVEPTSTDMHIAYRPGLRQPIDRAAPGLAILAGVHPRPGERPDVELARERGWTHVDRRAAPGATASLPRSSPGGRHAGSEHQRRVDRAARPAADRRAGAANGAGDRGSVVGADLPGGPDVQRAGWNPAHTKPPPSQPGSRSDPLQGSLRDRGAGWNPALLRRDEALVEDGRLELGCAAVGGAHERSLLVPAVRRT